MKRFFTLIAAIAALAGCATHGPVRGPQDLFFARLSALCGKAFEGRVVSPPVEADAAFGGKRLLMHVRDCSAEEIRIPFHVGEDRSRTWVVTRRGGGGKGRGGLILKHDHRHADGTPDVLTDYGGATASSGTAGRQEFPADAESKALFLREGRTESGASVWAIEAQPGGTFAYELRRPGRFFRVEFDTLRPIGPPRD
jgi:hypothetical protein